MSIIKDKFGPEYAAEFDDPETGATGFLVIDNTVLGPGKGGIRMTPDVSLGEVFRLARTMTWKNALADIPFGGAKAGLIAKWKSDAEKELHVRALARMLKPFVPSRYIAGPDASSGEREMKWFVEEIVDKKAATGKPAAMGGLPHELGSTGYGVAQAAKVASEIFGLDIRKATVAIEGFGNVGGFAFKHLQGMGAKIVAASDSKGSIFSGGGLDYEKAAKTKRERKSIIHYRGARKISNGSFWNLPVDILVTAALTDSINGKNKDLIRAKIIVEGSNIPVSEEIEDELWRRGVKIVPDLVANAGGVISSYAEYAGMDAGKMFELVERKIAALTKSIIEKSEKSGKNPRAVALEAARKKIAEAMSEKIKWSELPHHWPAPMVRSKIKLVPFKMRSKQLKTKIFLDSGDPAETREAIKLLGFLDGQTTNPTLIAKNPQARARLARGEKFSRAEAMEFYRKIVGEISQLVPGGSVSVETYADFSTTSDEMLREGKEMFTWIPNAHVKYPTTREGLAAAEASVKAGLRVNMTLCFSEGQAAAVYEATRGAGRGQVFLSPFVGRLDDIGENGMDLIRNIAALYARGDGHVEVLTASVRNPGHLLCAIKLGSDIITAPLKIIKAWAGSGLAMPPENFSCNPAGLKAIPPAGIALGKNWRDYDIRHPLTEKGIERFANDWNGIIL